METGVSSASQPLILDADLQMTQDMKLCIVIQQLTIQGVGLFAYPLIKKLHKK